jgi:AraC family transcriptional regulator, regulatory protein of adaptative response / methylphosphotriester-DNA alkyltransferase methyltransferase
MIQIAEQPVVSFRQKEIVEQYLLLLDNHMQHMREGKVERAMEISEFAAALHIHPVHLSNTIKEVTGQSTCNIYEHRLLELAKSLLIETILPIGQIAAQLTYDPSNFTKFFKTYAGVTPKTFRALHLK